MIQLNDLERLRAIGLAPHILPLLPEVHADDRLMRVVEVQRDSVMLHDGAQAERARVLPALHAALDNDAIAVGDWVYAQRSALAEWWVHARVPPVNQIARRLHDGRDKVTRVVLVANVDTVLIVMGLDHDFNPRRLERYLAFTRLARVGAVVVLTKADLASDEACRAREHEVLQLVPPDVAVLAVDATSVQTAARCWADAGRCRLFRRRKKHADQHPARRRRARHRRHAPARALGRSGASAESRLAGPRAARGCSWT
jgi:ribosome biogenesis GTPase / thiamine phosphate phosphatase